MSISLSDVLYKVAAPRDNWTFEPTQFWRTEDWSSSAPVPCEGHSEDWVLYAAEFDEVNIHLLPNVWRLRVWLDDEQRAERLRNLGYRWNPTSRAVVFARRVDRDLIESFTPTIYTFAKSGFAKTPSNEYVARNPQTALSAETIPFSDALRRWQFDVISIEDADALAQSLRSNRIDHQIQT